MPRCRQAGEQALIVRTGGQHEQGKSDSSVYEIATALTHSRWVPKGLYDRAVKALGHVGITDAITLMGYYTSVSMTLAFYDVPAGASGMAR